MNLTSGEREAVERGQAVPVMVGRTPCVIVRANVYERIAPLLDLEEFDPSLGYQAFHDAAGDEWNDSALDIYEQYRKMS